LNCAGTNQKHQQKFQRAISQHLLHQGIKSTVIALARFARAPFPPARNLIGNTLRLTTSPYASRLPWR
jgi:hypothetical protein